MLDRKLRMGAAHALRVASDGARRAASAAETGATAILGTDLARELQTRAVRDAMDAHDMVLDPDEAHYLEAYWRWIEERIQFADDGPWIDAGCGSGRITFPLARAAAKNDGRVVGIDSHAPAIEAARSQANTSGVANVEFVVSDLGAFLSAAESESVSGAMFIEVGFILSDMMGTLSHLHRVLKPGGQLFVTFRPTWFMIAFDAARGNWDGVEYELSSQSGTPPGWGGTRLNWSTRDQSHRVLEEVGFEVDGCTAIGALSGIAGDPLASFARPSELTERQRMLLQKAEMLLGATCSDTCRYTLFAARKQRRRTVDT